MIVVLFDVSCSKQSSTSQYQQLESQYNDLAQYWEIIRTNDSIRNSQAAFGFKRHFGNARDLINEYNRAGRDVLPGGGADFSAQNDEEILWQLKLTLEYASSYTNGLVNVK